MSYGEELIRSQKSTSNNVLLSGGRSCSYNFNGTIITFNSFEEKRQFLADIFGVKTEQVKIDNDDTSSSKVEIIETDNAKENKSITFVKGLTGNKFPSGAIKCVIYKDEIINNADKNGRIEFWLNTSKKTNMVYGTLIE